MKINKISNRILFLSPTVQAGWQPQSYKTDFQNLSTLGQGSYGIVWKAKHKKTGIIYAIKQIKKKNINSQKMLQHVRTQVKIMYCLNHPNIIKLYNHFQDQFSLYFILQFAEKGQLYKALMKQKQKKFSQQKAILYIRQITNAIKYIHDMKIIHRDIKPQNILISKDDELKLADFGWSNFTHDKDKRETYCGTLDYLAPQMVDKSHVHDYRVDIWSIGVLIYELCTGLSPFSYQLQKTNQLNQKNIKLNISQLNYKIPKEVSDKCKDLISKILIVDPQKRISIEGILSHPWVAAQQEYKLQNRQKIMNKLRQQFGVILQNKQQEIKKYQIFSKQQILNFSRIQSVINANNHIKKFNQTSDHKNRQLQFRVKQLEICNKRQQQQIKHLKNFKKQNQKIREQLKQQRQINENYMKKMEYMRIQIEQYEKKLKEYEDKSIH